MILEPIVQPIIRPVIGDWRSRAKLLLDRALITINTTTALTITIGGVRHVLTINTK